VTEPDRRPSRWRRLVGWVPAHRDGRLLFLLVFVTVMSTVFLVTLQVQTSKFEREIIANCQQINTANGAFNDVLNQQVTNVKNSIALTPAQKAQAVQVYGEMHLPISVCPH
jgi:hypothetical protein